MATIEERAIAAFNAINEREYKCSLAESQVSEKLYDQVKKEYSVAQNAFVQGAIYQRKIDIEKACNFACNTMCSGYNGLGVCLACNKRDLMIQAMEE